MKKLKSRAIMLTIVWAGVSPITSYAATFPKIFSDYLDKCNSVPANKVRVLVVPVSTPAKKLNKGESPKITIVDVLPEYPESFYRFGVLKAQSLVESVEAGTLVGMNGNFRAFLSRNGNEIVYKHDFYRIDYFDIKHADQPLHFNLRHEGHFNTLIEWDRGPLMAGIPPGKCSMWGILHLPK